MRDQMTRGHGPHLDERGNHVHVMSGQRATKSAADYVADLWSKDLVKLDIWLPLFTANIQALVTGDTDSDPAEMQDLAAELADRAYAAYLSRQGTGSR